MKTIVRRLTPTECERLQGFPDGWTDIGEWTDSKGKVHKEASDSARYKALGNSIALPFWQYLARRICAQYERDITIGSLFDGIGGFPYVFERCGAKAVWASEIEDFCIAVTKKHFPEEEKWESKKKPNSLRHIWHSLDTSSLSSARIAEHSTKNVYYAKKTI
jgi:DNA (cytosine-5)-methyltransferase 1